MGAWAKLDPAAGKKNRHTSKNPVKCLGRFTSVQKTRRCERPRNAFSRKIRPPTTVGDRVDRPANSPHSAACSTKQRFVDCSAFLQPGDRGCYGEGLSQETLANPRLTIHKAGAVTKEKIAVFVREFVM